MLSAAGSLSSRDRVPLTSSPNSWLQPRSTSEPEPSGTRLPVVTEYDGSEQSSEVRGAVELFDLLGQREEDVKALMAGVPGFVSYAAVRSGDGGVAVTICEDKAARTSLRGSLRSG